MRHDTIQLGEARLARYEWDDGVAALFVGNGLLVADRFLVSAPAVPGFMQVDVAWKDVARLAPDEQFGDLLRQTIDKALAERKGAEQHA